MLVLTSAVVLKRCLRGDADAGGGDDSPLLAVPPGSRDSKRLSTYEKSSYVRKDGTNDGRKSSGPRQRNIGAQYNAEKRGNSTRSKFQGALSDLATSTVPSIAKGIYEQDESTYNLKESIEEQKIFEVNDSLNHLISSLEDKQKLITEQNDEN